MQHAWKMSQRMWTTQVGRARLPVIAAAFGEQRSYQSSRGGGGGGNRRFNNNNRYNNNNNTRERDSDYESRRNGGYDPRNDNFFSEDFSDDTFGSEAPPSSFRNERRTSNYSSAYDNNKRDERGGGRGRGGSSYSSSSSYDNRRDERGGRGGGRGRGRGGGRESGRGGFREGGREDRRPYNDAPSNTTYNNTNTGPSLKDLWIADVVYGVSPVLAALEAGRRKIHTLYIQEGVDSSKGRKDKGAIATAMAKAKELGADVKSASKHDLNMVCDNRPHQGLVLDASELDFETLDTMPRAEDVFEEGSGKAPPVWLCLDEVVDPQNFGAALRSAFFLGATGVLTCKRNSAPLSPIVSKASAGALELMAVHSCRSLPQTLADAREKGWTVVGAAAEPGAINCASYKPQGPTILVMGNEGYGVRTTVRQQCDAMLQIDRFSGVGGESESLLGITNNENSTRSERAKKVAGMVDSLNVSVATGILLHQLLS